MIQTDICIIGAGPVGLFAVFEAGLLKMRCHLIDALPKIGGQLTEIYPRKPIYDIPGYPTILAEDLIKNLMEQIEPFKPSFTLGERVEKFVKNQDGSFVLTTSAGTDVSCKAVVIAGGLGCFEPRKPEIPQLEQYEGKGVTYMILNPETYRNKRVVLAGGGDSALDWTVFLADVAAELTLVHRSESFRGAPDSVEKVMDLAKEKKIRLLLKSNINAIEGNGKLTSISVVDQNKVIQTIPTDYFIPLFGLSPKLGPLENWGLNLDKSAIAVDTFDYSTTVPGVYAIGDINSYPGKLKLILCGFHEAALMAQSAYKIVYPNQKFSLKYTTVNGIQSF
jgi:thioredoxin reductase (NADPH)